MLRLDVLVGRLRRMGLIMLPVSELALVFVNKSELFDIISKIIN